MTTRRRNVLVLAAVVALAALAAFFFSPKIRARAAIEAIPDGAFLVVTIDLERLRQSPLAREVADLREVSDVTRECGFDPISRARAIAIGVPEKPDGVFGLSITHDLGKDELAKCAERSMGSHSATPRITQEGSWVVLEQEGTLTETTRAKIAYRDGAPLLVARGDYLATMQAALDGKRGRADADADHAALRKIAIAHAAKDGAILIATALLPKSLRDRLKDELQGEADTAETRKATMNAVLSVSALAVAVSARGDDLDVFVELSCESESACETVRDFVDKKRKAIAAEPAARFIGVGGLLDAVHLEVHGAALDVTLSAPESEIARATRAILSSAFAPSRPPPLPAQSSAPPQTRGPDETLHARDAQPGFSPRR